LQKNWGLFSEKYLTACYLYDIVKAFKIGNMLEQTMALLNLDDKDRQLYLVGLKFGAQPASVYAKKSGLKRGDAYNHLLKLVQAGLISQFEQGGITFFDIVELGEVKWQIDEKQRQVEIAHKELRIAKEQIRKRKHEPHWVKVRFYEGRDGILELMERTLTTNKSKLIRSLTSVNDFYDLIGFEYDLNHYIPTRLQYDIEIRKIVRRSPEMIQMKRMDSKEKREIRFVDDKWDFTSTMMIYDNEIMLLGVSKPIFGVLIQSKELAQFLKTVFDMCWEFASKTP